MRIVVWLCASAGLAAPKAAKPPMAARRVKPVMGSSSGSSALGSGDGRHVALKLRIGQHDGAPELGRAVEGHQHLDDRHPVREGLVGALTGTEALDEMAVLERV